MLYTEQELEQDLNKVLGYGRRFIAKNHSPDIRDELYSAWLIGVQKGLSSFKEGKSARVSWLITKAKYEVLEELKQRKALAITCSLNDINNSYQEDFHSRLDIEKTISLLSAQERLVCREVLKGISHREIGTKLSLSASRISQIWSAVKQKLKQTLFIP